MDFYINKGDEIELFKLLKAAGVCDYYSDIRHFIKDGLVSVNGEVNKLKHTMIKIDDLVEYKEHKIVILESRPKKEQREEREHISKEYKPQSQNIRHGKFKSWRPKPIELENDLENEISTLSQKLHEKLLFKKLTLSLAESCTGGMIQEMITSNSGASEYFMGGVVSYSNQAKINVLKVKSETINNFGAVSTETAIEMVKGTKKIFETDISASITGIAGPSGGTPEKPVGTIYLAVSINDKIITRKLSLSGNRENIRKKSVLILFKLLLENI
ncbi:MAG: RNA-binding S4 domain-containing protein [Candidatus Cloacimonetes bacterium]|jgi:PncC family amidohydrolase|nr:RNA-binding S4 domain-containing protein [Candidatus Cloacimonadota bacterium]